MMSASTLYTDNNGSVFINQESLNKILQIEKRGVQPHEFGFIPHAIPLFSSQEVTSLIPFAPTKDWLQKIYTKVKDFKVPNYRFTRIRVPLGLHIQALKAVAVDYDFEILAEHIEFGFPINVNHEKFNCNIDIVNHKSSVRPEGVHKYFETEAKTC